LDRQEANELAVKALGRKERTEHELRMLLRDAGASEADSADVIASLAVAGAIDDERFAKRYAEDKRELRDWGPDRIAEALRARGVAEAEVQAALASESGEEVVVRAVGVLADSGEEPIDDRSRQRALGLLARRGFPLEVAYEAVRAMERSEGADPAEAA
jgi:regulatory protein